MALSGRQAQSYNGLGNRGFAVRTVAYSCLMVLCTHTAALAGWFSYDSYEDCMLGRMKGQPLMMYATAVKACKKEFKIETIVYERDVKWEFSYGEISITSASDGTDDYEITSGQFAFSEKPCEGLKEADFDKRVQLQFIKGRATAPYGVACGRALSFMGKYK